MWRVAKGLRAIAAVIEARWTEPPARPPGPAGTLDDDDALDAALARAERQGIAHVGSPAITVETRPEWRVHFPVGGGITGWRIAGNIGYFRYFPPKPDVPPSGVTATRTAEEVWHAVLATDEDAPWCFVHDIRFMRGISREGRSAGIAAYRALARRLRASAMVATPAQEPLARAFQLLLGRDLLRDCSVHRRAVDAIRPCLTLDLDAPGEALDEPRWIDGLFGATELTLNSGRHVVLAPPVWRWESGTFRLRLALLDGRIVVARYDGSVRADEAPENAARYDPVRGAAACGPLSVGAPSAITVVHPHPRTVPHREGTSPACGRVGGERGGGCG